MNLRTMALCCVRTAHVVTNMVHWLSLLKYRYIATYLVQINMLLLLLNRRLCG